MSDEVIIDCISANYRNLGRGVFEIECDRLIGLKNQNNSPISPFTAFSHLIEKEDADVFVINQSKTKFKGFVTRISDDSITISNVK